MASLVVSLAAGPALAQSQPRREGERQQEVRREGGPVRVQVGGFGMGGGMGAGLDYPVSTRDLERLETMLALTPEQRDAARMLLEASQAEFEPVASAARQEIERAREEFRETRDPSVWADIRPKMEAVQASSRRLEAALLKDVQGLLTSEQASKWPAFERARRRERTVGRGMMAGERVDLIRLTERLEIDDATRAQLRPLLEQYELELDRELVKRNEVYDQTQSKMGELFEAARRAGGGFESIDRGAMDELLKAGREASVRVREVNRKYARQVEGLLPDEAKAGFTQQFKRESFPMVYRPTYGSRLVDAAVALDDLSDAQRTTLTQVREAHERQLAAINAQAEAAWEEFESTATAEGMMMMRFGNEGVDEARRKRRELDEQTEQKLRAVLTPEQRERLPRRGEGADGDRGEPGFGPGGPGGERRRRDRDADEGTGQRRRMVPAERDPENSQPRREPR
ncbi:MAG TPA: hypothetical protein VD963_07275 [Phycisphaerales bacterium]|nr:hypothetical protein [Phycisphaerales bacterium]